MRLSDQGSLPVPRPQLVCHPAVQPPRRRQPDLQLHAEPRSKKSEPNPPRGSIQAMQRMGAQLFGNDDAMSTEKQMHFQYDISRPRGYFNQGGEIVVLFGGKHPAFLQRQKFPPFDRRKNEKKSPQVLRIFQC